MSGASSNTQRVAYVNANWAPETAGPGAFELLVVTEEGERYALKASPDAITVVVALTRATGRLLWDPDNGTLVAANIAGEWFQSDWEPGMKRVPGRPAWAYEPPER